MFVVVWGVCVGWLGGRRSVHITGSGLKQNSSGRREMETGCSPQVQIVAGSRADRNCQRSSFFHIQGYPQGEGETNCKLIRLIGD
jgi:hypothetical protein